MLAARGADRWLLALLARDAARSIRRDYAADRPQEQGKGIAGVTRCSRTQAAGRSESQVSKWYALATILAKPLATPLPIWRRQNRR
jgi:hypothetical protein